MSSRPRVAEKRRRDASEEMDVDAVQQCPECEKVDIETGNASFALGCSDGCKIFHVCFAKMVTESHFADEFTCPCCNEGFTSFKAVYSSVV